MSRRRASRLSELEARWRANITPEFAARVMAVASELQGVSTAYPGDICEQAGHVIADCYEWARPRDPVARLEHDPGLSAVGFTLMRMVAGEPNVDPLCRDPLVLHPNNPFVVRHEERLRRAS